MKNIFLSLLCLFVSLKIGAQGWERFYNLQSVRSSVQLPDGDYLLLCSANGQPAHIIRTDEIGTEKWKRPLPGISVGRLITYLNTGNLSVIASDFGNAHRIMELDTAANILWSNPINSSSVTMVNVFPTESGYLSVHVQQQDTVLAWKWDMLGNILWERKTYVPGVLPPNGAGPSLDGGFLVASPKYNEILLAKFDPDGDLQWTVTTGAPTNDDGFWESKVTPTADGGHGVAVVGAGPDAKSIRTFKFGPTGTLQWWGDFQPPPHPGLFQNVINIIETPDHGLAVLGRVPSIGIPTVIKFNEAGEIDFYHVSNHAGQFTNILNTLDGGYHITGFATDLQSGSSVPSAYALKLDGNGVLYPNLLKGKCTFDQNNDCLVSAEDFPLEGWIVRAEGQFTTYGVTDTLGHYCLRVDTGAYQLYISRPNDLWLPCESPVDISVGYADTILTDFAVQAGFLCPFMQVDIGRPFLRRCFPNDIVVQYCNHGTVTAVGATIEVTLDSLLEFSGSDIAPSGQVGNTLIFDLGDVGVMECGSFTLTAIVNCNAELGQTLCMEAHIFPDSICGTAFNYAGASMMARAKCEGDSIVVLELENVGSNPTSVPLGYIVIEDQIIFMQGEQVFEPAQVVSFPQTANGATWHIVCEQEPNHPGFLFPTAFVEGCGTNGLGTFSTGFANGYPMADGNSFIDIDCEVVVGAYDPNDKSGMPEGYGNNHYLEANTDIEYRIRFQNTGTDTAFNVVIRDTLSPFLNPSSIRPGASSHPYEFEFEGNGIAKFSFKDIMLPDSNINEPGSHGFVGFKISQRPSLTPGIVIHNSAAIYFDFNEPIITNQTVHTIGEPLILVMADAVQPPKGFGSLLASPNPSAGSVLFEIPSKEVVPAAFTLYDGLGRPVRNGIFSNNQFRLQRDGLSAGMYFYRVNMTGVGFYTGKILLQ